MYRVKQKYSISSFISVRWVDLPRTVQVTRVHQKLGRNICPICKQTIPVGTKAVSCGRKKSLRYYHIKCFESLYYDISDEDIEQLEDYLLLNGGID